MQREEKIKSLSPRATAGPFCFRLGRFSQAFPSRAVHVPVAAQTSFLLVPDPTPCPSCMTLCQSLPAWTLCQSLSPVTCPEVTAWSCPLCPSQALMCQNRHSPVCLSPLCALCSSLQGHPGAVPLWPFLPILLLRTGTVAEPLLVCSFVCTLGKEMKAAGRVIKQQMMLCCCASHFPW